MGSQSDWATMKEAADILVALDISYESRIVSAHRTPDRLWDYGKTAVSRGLQVIIAGAGGAAHLPGMMASKTRLPVIGVPVQTKALSGVDSLYSILQMPRRLSGCDHGDRGGGRSQRRADGRLAFWPCMTMQNWPARLEAWRAALVCLDPGCAPR